MNIEQIQAARAALETIDKQARSAGGADCSGARGVLAAFIASAEAALTDSASAELVPGLGHPTTFGELGRLTPNQLWNRWYPHDRSVSAREAFLGARSIPFALSAELVRDAARFHEARQHAYRYGVGNPLPAQFDAEVDAGIAARAAAVREAL